MSSLDSTPGRRQLGRKRSIIDIQTSLGAMRLGPPGTASIQEEDEDIYPTTSVANAQSMSKSLKPRVRHAHHAPPSVSAPRWSLPKEGNTVPRGSESVFDGAENLPEEGDETSVNRRTDSSTPEIHSMRGPPRKNVKASHQATEASQDSSPPKYTWGDWNMLTLDAVEKGFRALRTQTDHAIGSATKSSGAKTGVHISADYRKRFKRAEDELTRIRSNVRCCLDSLQEHLDRLPEGEAGPLDHDAEKNLQIFLSKAPKSSSKLTCENLENMPMSWEERHSHIAKIVGEGLIKLNKDRKHEANSKSNHSGTSSETLSRIRDDLETHLDAAERQIEADTYNAYVTAFKLSEEHKADTIAEYLTKRDEWRYKAMTAALEDITASDTEREALKGLFARYKAEKSLNSFTTLVGCKFPVLPVPTNDNVFQASLPDNAESMIAVLTYDDYDD